MICINNVIIRIPGALMERFVRMVLSSAPTLDKDLHIGDVFKIGVLITAKNVSETRAFIYFEPEFIQLVDSPREVDLGAGSYEVEAEWLLRARQSTRGTTIRVECKADDVPQVIEFPLHILPNDEGAEDGETNEAIQQ
jgi:hypothetical protein